MQLQAPEAATGGVPLLRHSIWSRRSMIAFTLVGILLAAGLSLCGLAITSSPIAELDDQLLEAVAGSRPSWLVSFARGATVLGDLRFVAALTLLIVGVSRYRTGRWDVAGLTLAASGGSFAVTGVVKLIADRPRPPGALMDVTSASFPSGHTVRGLALYGLIAWLCWRYQTNRTARRLLTGLVALLAAATPASRIILGAHWPSDVVASALLAALWLSATLHITSPSGQTPTATETRYPSPGGFLHHREVESVPREI